MTPLHQTIESAKGDFAAARATIEQSFATTPDDRMNWSPSPTARTPIEIFAHAAESVKNVHHTLDGDTFSIPTTEEAERGFREWERGFTTREAVLALMETNAAAYLAWLDTLTEERLDTMVTMPYRMGSAPMRIALTFAPMHTRWHAGQIDYVQTIYGDHDWHSPFEGTAPETLLS